jgi:predicted PurR-regulated permease PerM
MTIALRKEVSRMNRDTTNRILLVILLLAVLATAYRVVAPFIAGFTWAAVLVAAFRPLQERLARVFRGRQKAATATVTLLVAAFVVVPLLAAAVAALQGATQLIQSIAADAGSGAKGFGLLDQWPRIGNAIDKAEELLGMADVDLRGMAASALQKLGSFLADQGPSLVGGAVGLAFTFGVTLVAMPALFSKGEHLSRVVGEALPVPDADGKRIVEDLTLMTRSVFMSVALTAATQAALGVPHDVTLTAVMFFCALVPGGTAIVWAPAAIWLAATGHPWKAIVLAAWGAGVVSTIDNVLRPFFAGKGAELPGGALFLGMFGGMIAFGLVGLFLGPIALYLTRELLAILRRDTPATAA